MTNAIVTVEEFEVMQRMGQALVKSGYFSDVCDVAQALVKIQAGRELGLQPFAATTGIHIIKGKPVLGANLIASIIKNDPRYDYRVSRLDDKGCSIDFYEHGEKIGTAAFSEADAKSAGLAGDNWKKYPRNMYFARAISNGAKWYTPGIFGGSPVYTPGELGDDEGEPDDFIEGVVTIPAEAVLEMAQDPEHANEIAAKAAQAPQDEPPASNGSGRPLAPAKLREFIQRKMGTDNVSRTASTKQLNLLRMVLDTVCEGDTDKRHTITGYLTGLTSTKDLTGPMVVTLLDWLKPEKDSGGAYVPDKYAEQEARAVWTAALAQEGQAEIPFD